MILKPSDFGRVAFLDDFSFAESNNKKPGSNCFPKATPSNMGLHQSNFSPMLLADAGEPLRKAF